MSSVMPAPESIVRPALTVLVTQLSGGGALVRDYLAGIDLAPFYAGHPGDIHAYARKAAEVDGRLGVAQRARVAAAIEPLGDAADRMRRILAGDGYFITTGQQPALFGGPLYTLYKVLAAIKLAAVMESALERPCLALFWIGADDHDWDEANHTTIIDGSDRAVRIEVRAAHAAAQPQLPLSERVWGAGVTRAVEELIAHLPSTQWSSMVAAHVRDAYTPHMTVADSFTATMRLLLQDRRVAFVSSAHPAVRRAAMSVLLREAERMPEHTRAVVRQTARLVDAGYSAQVAINADAANIMLHDEHGRDRLMRTRSGWVTRREKHGIDDAALRARLHHDPDSFSPNVLLRPVVESAVFPTIAYVAGPAELSYFAQIGCLFLEHGMLPPVAVPRRSVTLIEPTIERLLQRVGLEPAACARPFDELVSAVVRRDMPAPVRDALARTRAALLREYEELGAAAAALDPTLRGPVIRARNAALHRLNHAERKVVRQLKRRNATLIEQLRRIWMNLHPRGVPQERMLTPLHFLARYGPNVVTEIADALDMTPVPVAAWTGPRCDE